MSESNAHINEKNITRYATTSTFREEIIHEVKKVEGVEIDDNLKAPICCIVGHVDAGKTSLLDKLRNTDIQAKEAGGITQHIGSTFFPIETIKQNCSAIKGKFEVIHKIPGILMIDTPGHSEFQSLRDVGTSICDLGILIIDIEESVQEQTREAIKLLKEKNIPFVVAVTKLDKIYGWTPTKSTNLRGAIKEQTKDITMMLESKLEDIKYDLSKEDINAEFYFKNTKPEKTYSIIPVSSKTGEGIADLLSILVYISQTWMLKKLTYKEKVKCTIMETKYDNQLGYTIDVILSNGTLSVGDKFAIATSDGPKITTIRNILTPTPMTQLGKKTSWSYHTSVRASIGIKIIGSNLDGAYPGTILQPIIDNNENDAITLVKEDIDKVWKSYILESPGVFFSAQTFGELEAGYSIFKKAKINVAGVYIGQPSTKILDRINTAIESETLPENRMYFYFGHFNDSEILEYAKNKDIKLISSEVIYQLVELYKKEKEQIIKSRQTKNSEAVFPVQLSILKQYIFMKGGNEDLLFGVKVKKGTLYKNTPIIVTGKNVILGKVTNIQFNHKDQEKGNEGQEVCIRLDNPNKLIINRHFDETDTLIGNLNRESIDVLKRDYKEIVPKKDWLLVIEHMKLLGIK
jgi:translation initiation factor 5B